MTTKEIKKMFEHQYPGGEEILEMACEGGAIYEVHDKWIRFLDELLNIGIITKQIRETSDDEYFGKQIKKEHEETVEWLKSLKEQ
jgi:hypothetical protein